jgi:RecB family exonuclease
VPTFYPTQLQTYLQCPRKYAFSKDREVRAKYARASPHMVLGNAAHDALHAFFDVGKVAPGERTVERLQDLFRDAWGGRGIFVRNKFKQREAREQAFGADKEAESAWGRKGLDMLWRYFQTTDRAAVPLTAEQFHEVWLTERVTLGGKIDRIDRRADGSLEILDYKTGKPPRTRGPLAGAPPAGQAPPSARVSRPLGEDDIQLAAYALLVTRKFRGRVARCTYVFLNDDLDLWFEPTDADLAAKEGEITALCERILADGTFAATPNPLCGWCDYRPICPEGEAFAKDRADGAGAPEEVPF